MGKHNFGYFFHEGLSNMFSQLPVGWSTTV